MTAYYRDLLEQEEEGADPRGLPTPSVRIRLPARLLSRIDNLATDPAQPFMDRSEAIRALICDGFRFRGADTPGEA
jgi:hypothetical protein